MRLLAGAVPAACALSLAARGCQAFLVAPAATNAAALTTSRSLQPLSSTAAGASSSTTTSPATDPASEVFATDKRPVVLFDGVCNFCNRWVDAALRLDPDGTALRFTPLQGEVGRALLRRAGRSSDDISSIVLVDESGAFTKSDAVLRISQALGGPAPVLSAPGFLVPQFARDGLYDLVANNRYSFLGKRETCRCSDPQFADRFI